MAKTTKRVSFKLTKTFTYTVDMPGWSNYTDNQALEQANLPNGSNVLGELLAGSSANNGTITSSGKVISIEMTNAGSGYTSAPTVSFSGGGGSGAAATAVLSGTTVAGVVITNQGSGYTAAPTVSFSGGAGSDAAATAYISAWLVTGTSSAIEQYSMYTNSYAYNLGDQITGTSPTNRLYVCKTAGTSGTTEPTWSQTIGGNTTAGTASFITVDKFVSVATFAVSTAYTLGQVVKPTSGSASEFVVTTAGTSASSAPTWPTTIGGSVTSGTATFLCRSIG